MEFDVFVTGEADYIQRQRRDEVDREAGLLDAGADVRGLLRLARGGNELPGSLVEPVRVGLGDQPYAPEQRDLRHLVYV